MDVLNTTGGYVDPVLITFAIIFIMLGIGAIIVGVMTRSDGFVIAAYGLALVGVLFLMWSPQPVRHEVTLRPGYVIDAEKYTIVKHRGEIYVIEERKQGAAK